jgi:hypothetical protein
MNVESKTAIKQIYNACQRYKHDIKGEKFEIQELLKYLEDHKYFHKVRTIGKSSTIQDIF